MCNARKRERSSQECNLNVDRPKIHVERIKLEQKQERKRINEHAESASFTNEQLKRMKCETTSSIESQQNINILINNTKENRIRRRNLNMQKKLAYLSIPHGMIHFSVEYIQHLKESYPRRSYYGIATNVCKYCGAIFWFEERIRHQRYRDKNTIYTQCCKEGKIKIPPFKEPPEPLSTLLKYNGDNKSKHFLDKIRQYNSLFSFTSMGGNIDKCINQGDGPYVFRINGQIHHRIGSLLPQPNNIPKFVELYIFDTQNEINNRLQAITHEESSDTSLDLCIIEELRNMLDKYNPLVKKFRKARDLLEQYNGIDVTVRIIGAGKDDPIQYEMPSADELAMLIVGDYSIENYKHDIKISIYHPAYMALQYPLLFPYGERGYQINIYYNNDNGKQKRLTMHDYFKYQIHYRPNMPNPYLCYGRLSKQIVVDARACEDEDRLLFIARNQSKLRVEYLQGITDAIEKGVQKGEEIGKRVFLPCSHIGSRRYMIQNYHDGIAICRVYGPPDLFITFTPKWLEILQMLLQGQQPNDRPDIIVRVFHMKLQELLHDIESAIVFGPIDAILYSIEFQKRGLPHAHILVWLSKNKINITYETIDNLISAEIPDPNKDPLGYVLVAEHMIHGPCGDKNPNCPCMKKGKCSKFFPKEFEEETKFDDNGFTKYKRRNTGVYVCREGHNLDNKWVVPYNIFLLKKYQAHINVEYCNKSRIIKYLCKYVHKGPDKAKIIFQRIKRGEDAPQNIESDTIDEIKEYLDCRYLCEQDALWRLFGFEIHHHTPPVERLPVHLPLMNNVTLKSDIELKTLLKDPKIQKTMLTEWFTANQQYENAHELTYCEFPTKWTWDQKNRKWNERKHGFKIGRLYYVNPTEGERFYLRMLLMVVKGAKSFNDIKTYNGVVYNTFKDACSARGLLNNDDEWYQAFKEASTWSSSFQLRQYTK